MTITMTNEERIAIIGSGCRFPGSCSTPTKLWELLSNPSDIARKIPPERFNIDGFYHEDGKHHGTTNAREAYLLTEDISAFDASFFNISSTEAESIDPQQRILLETVYESLESAGMRLEDLKGTTTGIFAGVMTDDFGGVINRDIDALPQYTATGTARSILSNRVSYFFDWKGPSMTIDTACSSSLVAVHMAAKALNDRECPVAVAAGANLIFSPNMFVSESNLSMLSPNGRSRMWDASADGYARGEGIAAVVMKRLEDALADGDPIECVIRATHINQDGRSAGITMPSSVAQTELIRATYKKAGLDLARSSDRCQYFEAHGTGTPAGDPQEASAISEAFFGAETASEFDTLYVGSVKTVIGHTEGTAGLAGVIKAMMAMKHKLIPPNLHFKTLNPKLEPYYTHLHVPTELQKWPDLPPGVPLRASVNSFGFGGTNAHVILESHEPKAREPAPSERALVLPIVFSAPSERALTSVLGTYSEFLSAPNQIDIHDLAWSLFSRRSAFTFKISFSAQSIEDLCFQLNAELELRKGGKFASISSRIASKSRRILGIFTGQGAQWPRMGYDLVRSSQAARDKFQELENALATLPEEHRPKSSLLRELSAGKEASRVAEAALSQPLCTAVQLVLVDLLHAAGISFAAVVGHSSGEIAAAYAAGHINAIEAIRIAYYRGFFAYLAGANGKEGAMLAAGMDFEEAKMLCQRPEFHGRVAPAASNSSASVTLSGDIDAVTEVETFLKAEGTFARILKVDTAYHSHHMLPCSELYTAALERCNIVPRDSSGCQWFSSVLDGKLMAASEFLKSQYWKDNMVNSVLFSQALSAALQDDDSYDLIMEVGPHPALKGPALQVISDVVGSSDRYPYTGILKRDFQDASSFASGIGMAWSHLGVEPSAAARLVSLFDGYREPIALKNLPTYPFDRDRTYWAESRISKVLQKRKDPPNMLLGSRIPDAAEEEWRWRNYLRPSEISWLGGHQIQSQTVFPATGYIAMALEASKAIAAGREISLLEIDDFQIGRAIAFNDDWKGVETLFKIDKVSFHKGETTATAHFGCYANHGGMLGLCAEGLMTITFGSPSSSTLPPQSPQGLDLLELDIPDFYQYLKELGYGYSGLFQGLYSLMRKKDTASGYISNSCLKDPKPTLMHHPALMDTLLQTLLASVGHPGDGRLFSLHVPTSIEKVTINPCYCGEACQGLGEYLSFNCSLTNYTTNGVRGDIDLFTSNGESAMIQMEGVHVSPLMAPRPSDDRLLFSEVVWGPLHPDANLASAEVTSSSEMAKFAERLSLCYLKSARDACVSQRQRIAGSKRFVIQWIDRLLNSIQEGTHPTCKEEWLSDSIKDLHSLSPSRRAPSELQIIDRFGRGLVQHLQGDISLRKDFIEDSIACDLLDEFADVVSARSTIAGVVSQLTFRFPRMKILEIGAGSGYTTQDILERIGDMSYHSYTFTDCTTDAVDQGRQRFSGLSERFSFKKFDINVDPKPQEMDEGFYDLVIISNITSITGSYGDALNNIHKLLKPGGYGVFMEAVDNGSIRLPYLFSCLEKTFIDENDETVSRILPTQPQWSTLLENAGFSGLDTIASQSESAVVPISIFVTQVLDDTIRTIREPLTVVENVEKLNELIIIGGRSKFSSQLTEQITRLLLPSFHQLKIAPDFDSLDVANSALSTVLCLAELDAPVFKGMDERQLGSLQKLMNSTKNLLWVSTGSTTEKLYESMTPAVLRSVAYEFPHIHYQYLQIKSATDISAAIVASALLRVALVDTYNEVSCPEFLWSTEPEVYLDRGISYISRIHTNDSMNRRYMAARRVVKEEMDPQESAIAAIPTAHGYDLEALLRRRKSSTNTLHIQVEFSTLSAIKTKGGDSFHLVFGRRADESKVLALSRTNGTIVPVHPHCCVDCTPSPEQEASMLSSTSKYLIADYLTSLATPNSTILVHEADPVLRRAISTRARLKNARTYFTTTDSSARGPNLRFLHPRSSVRGLKALLPKAISVFANLQSNSALIGSRLREAIPRSVAFEDVDSLYVTSSPSQESSIAHEVAESLNTAYLLSLSTSDPSVKKFTNVIDITELPSVSSQLNKAGVIDWTTGAQVPVKVHTASSHVYLHPQKTYLLVGLTGDLGRSVCRWMVERGARNLVLTSRKPAVDPEWVSQMATLGARVEIHSMDVASKSSLKNLDNLIRETMPPVGGVVNGAMVLKDVLFSDMSADTLNRTLTPKVDGSLNLNDHYWDTDLDFFILFGSLAAVAGNRGQSAYAAANTFMSSLIKRRREYGRPGSIINPGEIRGVGYVARMGQTLQEELGTLSYLSTSEHDLHELFAEAILAGVSTSDRNPELIAGPTMNDPEINPDIIWYSNPLMWNFIVYDATSSSGASSEGTVSIREQLKTLTSREDVHAAIVVAFIDKVRSKLQLSVDDHISPDTLLIELGVDSLTAVDLRAWFVKELSTDMPILKFVGGSSIEQIVDEAVQKLPASVAPNFVSEEESIDPKATVATPQQSGSAPMKRVSSSKSTEGSTRSLLSSSALLKNCLLDSRSLQEDTITTPGTSVFSEALSAESSSDDSSEVVAPESESKLTPTRQAFERTEELSFAQLRYWFLTQYIEDKSVYNVTLYERVSGQVRIEDLKSAVRTVANRHHTLRTCYIRNENGEPRQAILPSSLLSLETCLVESEEEADLEFQNIRDHVYDLEHGEVARIRFVTIGSNRHFLIIGYHHIAFDAASLHIMLGELEAAYMKRPLPPVALQYTDYAVQQRVALSGDQLSKEIAYWKSEFPEVPEPLPLLPMAKVRSRPMLKQYDLDDITLRVDGETTKKLRAGCKKGRATAFHFFLAVLRVVLNRFVESEDFCIGVADANRLDASTQNTIGFLLNLLPLRFTSSDAQESFGSVLANTRDKAYKAIGHSKIPFDKLLDELSVPRSAQHSPLFQVLMDWQPATKDSNSFGPHKSETKELSAGNTPYDITLLVTESSRSDIKVKFRFQKALYDRNGAELFARSYLRSVQEFANGFEKLISEPQLYEDSDLDSALTVGVGRTMVSNWPSTVSKRIEQLCMSQPDHIALKDGHQALTYAKMMSRANQIAAVLSQAGVQSESAVTLFQHPTSNWVCCMLAIWKLNGIYVPLDLRAPLPRLSTMVNDCQPAVILYHNETEHELDGLNFPSAKAINVDHVIARRDLAHISDLSQPDSSAVILYTSGSTGKPKGIVLRHSSLRNQVEGYGSEWGLRAEIALQQGAMTFNHSLDQIFSGLCNGGSVFVVPRSLRGDPISLSKLVAAEGITYTKATPAEYSAWLAYGFEHLSKASNWRLAFGGGEHFSTSLARSFRALALPQLRLFNSYGPGEITISSHKMEIFYQDVDSYAENVYPVGFSLPNYSTYIVDTNQRPVPIGVSGEIIIAGSGPCVGYLHQEQLNAEKFITSPFISATYKNSGWNKAYRTFDRGHLRPDGSLVIEGRLDGDTQIKLRGIRMELEDIENTIIESSDGQLNSVIVSLREEQSQFLVAHVGFSPQFESDEEAEKASYLKALSTKLPLPQYMCPSIMVPLDRFPLNVHGKVDRKAVATLAVPRSTAQGDVTHDLNDDEVSMRDIWAQVLDERFIQVSEIGRETDFFLAGGSSVLLVKLQGMIHRRLSVMIPLVELFEASSLGEMTAKAQVTGSTASIDWPAEVSIDDIVANLRPSRRLRETRAGISVIITGATGFLGGHIIEDLCASDAIAQIHAVAVRPRANNNYRLRSEASKISVYDGDLSKPLFGLSQAKFDDLAASADVIIHCGANRSFWDPYPLLRSANVESTKTIISLAAGQRIPIHYLSSGGVAEIANYPPVDGSDGYVASKWASEQLLENASQALAIPVTIHRPTRGSTACKPDDALIHELQRMVEELQCVPIAGSWSGSFALLPVKDVTHNIITRVENSEVAGSRGIQVIAHEASMSVGTSDVIAAVQSLEKYKELEQLSAIRWLGRAKQRGFTYLLAGQDATIGVKEEGASSIRSRR